MSGIMFDVKLFEWNYHPVEIPTDKYDNIRKTVGFIVQLSRHLYSTGKAVVLDSGFFVLQGIIEIRK